ncbi:MAG: alpha-2-macroglobulin family protein [Bacteroidota bacterium]
MSKDFYAKAWKEIDKFIAEGLPASALKKVEEVYQRAEKEKAADHLVKSVIYQLKLTDYKEENAFVKNLIQLREEAEKAQHPVKPLLHSMLAEMYWQYYTNNRWRFNQRTQVVGFEPDDIETWSLEDIVAQTIKYYERSLEEAEQSKAIKIDVYDALLQGGNAKGRSLRPTLYDFLAHRAVDFYASEEPTLSKPVYQFYINEEKYLQPITAFTQLDIISKDSLSFKLHALQILQELAKLHLKDTLPDALVHIDLKRLDFVYRHLTLSNKDDLYLTALKALEQRTSLFPISTTVIYQMASVWRAKEQYYNPLQSDDHKWDLKKAYELCERAKVLFPKSEGAVNATGLQTSIQYKQISVKIEEETIPTQPFKAYIQYKNTDKIYWRIIKTSRKEVQAERIKWDRNYNVDREQKFLEHFLVKTPVKTGEVSLPLDGDYQLHATEIKLDALPLGEYMVLVSDKADFRLGENSLSYGFTTVSNLSYIHRSNAAGKAEVYVLNRQTGAPMVDVSVQMYFTEYSSRRRRYVRVNGPTLVTDKEGYAIFPHQTEAQRRNFLLDFKQGEDFNSTSEIDTYQDYGNIHQYKQRVPTSYTQVFFFTDRAIYRPNQTLYYKGLAVTTNGKDTKILKNYTTMVYFYDVNHQVVAQMEATTNEYGTFEGTFTTPAGGLMGQMYLKAVNSTHNFSVEEYKRPQFEVTFQPIEGSPRLNEEVVAVGKAKAYSGANIDGAQVQYRVVREAKFPYWWYYWRGYYPSSPAMEITKGVIQTDEQGQFEVKFSAMPDQNVAKEAEPTFTYTVYADVTDINGETHSQRTFINVGYKTLNVRIELPEKINQTEAGVAEKTYEINTTNLMGTFQAAKGEIKIYRLKTPDRFYRQRLLPQPDLQIIPEKTYRELFPHDPYKDENNHYNWARETQVFSQAFNTAEEKNLLLNSLSTWKQGRYVLEITSQDQYGQAVKGNTYFTVFSTKSNQMPFPTYEWTAGVDISVEPNETAQILYGTSTSAKILYEVEHQGEIIERKWLNLKEKQSLYTIPIKETYRGNIATYFTFIKENRLYRYVEVINVPYTNKELDIEFQTFRDKLQPGEEEEWRLTVKGKKGDQVAAEMVATLYDASLDVFRPNQWYLNLYHSFNASLRWDSRNEFSINNFKVYERSWNKGIAGQNTIYYDALNWFNYSFYSYYYRSYEFGGELEEVVVSGKNKRMKGKDKESVQQPMANRTVADEANEEDGMAKPAMLLSDQEKKPEDSEKLEGVKVRTNFNETAFFYPAIRTNEQGELVIAFTIPEALTRWKMMGLAHTQDLQYGLIDNELVTQKELMVVPNRPRFFRENDRMQFSVKISSLVEKALAGEAELQFFDALTMESIDSKMGNQKRRQKFSLAPEQSTSLNWSIEIPEGIQAITYRVVAKAGKFSDGEERLLPVVTNRMLVTETLPLPIRGNQTKQFKFEKLANNTSETLRHQRFTLEFTSNPAWYAVQALPYLMEYPYECVEQTFSRFYANSIASHIANAHPKIKQVFNTWKNIQPDALLSNLEKNQELKTALLEETPWVLDAKDESERKRRVGVLFDLNRMANEQEKAIRKILKAQVASGGFVWFKGFPEDRYMTQHIIAGVGHLDVLGVKKIREESRLVNMTNKALGYMDRELKEDYDRLKGLAKRGKIKLEDDHLGYIHIHYLYTRSYFTDKPIPQNTKEAFNYFMGQAKKYWIKRSIYMQGMIALSMHRYKEEAVPQAIVKSLNERALNSEEMGMYWKTNRGYWWYQAPIERQALLIEMYDEVTQDQEAVEAMKVWLLKQKQTQNWKTTKATVEACYALLRRGTDLLTSDKLVKVKVGDKTVDPRNDPNISVEAGTGYYKTAWTANEINTEMGNITVTKENEGVAWGAVYWQYFEQLDKITSAETPLKLKKQLFIQKNSDTGPVLTPISEENSLKVGDLVKVRIELRVDRDMEYVHLKDMRASAFEPVSTLSTYKYQDGLYYYESPRDLATNFFMGRLNKGTYVFEYTLRVSQKGDFSNGITTIQCMYAPEFSSHSAGIRVTVE